MDKKDYGKRIIFHSLFGGGAGSRTPVQTAIFGTFYTFIE